MLSVKSRALHRQCTAPAKSRSGQPRLDRPRKTGRRRCCRGVNSSAWCGQPDLAAPNPYSCRLSIVILLLFLAYSVVRQLVLPTHAMLHLSSLQCGAQAPITIDQVVLEWGGVSTVLLARITGQEGPWLCLQEVHRKLGISKPFES